VYQKEDPEPLPAALAEVLDEAEIYLLPQWADLAAAERMIEQVATSAPHHTRVTELRSRLQQLQHSGPQTAAALLVEQAVQRLAAQDYWGAVDLFEEALEQEPDHLEALRGVEDARQLARWSALLTGAGSDVDRLLALGDEYAEEAPNLAAQAYAEAFAARPSAGALRGQLQALIRSNKLDILVDTARNGVRVLQADGILLADSATAVLGDLAHSDISSPELLAAAVTNLADLLAAESGGMDA
jgi:tetratricopeptide (TPR) repeat protein